MYVLFALMFGITLSFDLKLILVSRFELLLLFSLSTSNGY